MRSIIGFLAAWIAVGSLLSGCDVGPGEFDEQMVVLGSLEEGLPPGPVTLSRTVPIDQAYDPVQAAVREADVWLEMLDDAGDVEETFPYAEDPDIPGLYRFDSDIETNPSFQPVVGGRTYRLVVRAEGEPQVTAQTTVPTGFEVLETPEDTVQYQYNQQGPPVRLSLSESPGRQSVYTVQVRAVSPRVFEEERVEGENRYVEIVEPETFRPTTVVRDILDCNEQESVLVCDSDPGAAEIGRSPLINEAFYTILGDGTARLSIPWLAVGFFGPQDVSFYALDDAMVDFVQTQSVQMTPTTLSPGEIPNVTTNVQGALGVFGSYARASFDLFIVP